MVDAILSFLGNEETGRALGIVGGALAATCVAGWAIFKHTRSRDSHPKADAFLSLQQYQQLLSAEQDRISRETLASGKSEREKLRRRQTDLTRKLADIEKAYSDAVEQNKELTNRIDELSQFADRSDFEKAAQSLRARNFDEARTYFTRCLDRLNPVLKDAAASHLGMAITCEERGDWAGAAKNYSTALALNEDEYTLGQASKFLWLAGDPTGAIHLSRKLLDQSISRSGRSSDSTASAMNLLAGQLYEVGEYGEARSYLTEGLSILGQDGKKDYRYASSLANLANIHLVEKDYGTAERLLREALPILESDKDSFEFELAARNSLAEVLRLQGHGEQSLVLMDENMAKTIDAFGRMHPHTARALNFLGKSQLQGGKPEAALRSFLDAFEIQRDCLGEFHHNTVSIAANVIYLVDDEPSLSNAEISDRMAVYRKMLEDMRADQAPE